ncbi:hypothetical protein [Chitinophaga hostae]|uniref:Uncharacterized protein n=1 Tax=Chitinophaga hostae TaxID=2831022 RepID=A0ABS5J7D3_9BACT|nr:hypothetical protein [Chitinophaga hostae]MBS0031095.1 hypothetical protein [Chitinophaga hostae]
MLQWQAPVIPALPPPRTFCNPPFPLHTFLLLPPSVLRLMVIIFVYPCRYFLTDTAHRNAGIFLYY